MLIKIRNTLIDPEEVQTVTPDRNEEREQVLIGFKGGCSCWIEGTMEEAEAALINAGVMIDPAADPEENETPLPELDAMELWKLGDLNAAGFRYLARDKDGKLYAFRHKPVFDGFYWSNPEPGSADAPQVFVSFSFINWDDNEPFEISRILKD